MHLAERSSLSPTRRALLMAGLITLALSLVLSIAPAWAKGGNAGTVKLHDVSTDVDPNATDPTVCTFTVVFDFPDPTEAGTWQVVTWNGSADHILVASGTYDTAIDGIDETAPQTLPAGHYRLEYQPLGAPNAKTKTFWVGDACAVAATPSADPSADPTVEPSTAPSTEPTTPPSDDPSASADPSSSPDPSATGPATPTSDPSSDPSQPPSDEPSDQPTDEPSDVPSEDPSTAPSASPPDAVVEPSDGPSSEPSSDPTGSPSDQPSDEPAAPPSDDPSHDPSTAPPDGATDSSSSPSAAPVTDPAQAGDPTSSPEGAVEGTTSQGGSVDHLPDTAFDGGRVLTSLLTALGLLLVVAAHPFLRRSAPADRA